MTKPTKNMSFPCELEMIEQIKRDAKRRSISGSELVRQAVFEHLRRNDKPMAQMNGEEVHRPTLDAAISAIRSHDFLQWLTVDREKAGDVVAKAVSRQVDP